jgi:hypothetical protein
VSKVYTNTVFAVEKGSLMVTQVVMFLLQRASKEYILYVNKPSRGEFVPNGRLFCKTTEIVFGRQRKKTSHV